MGPFDRPETIISSGLFACSPIMLRESRITSPYLKSSAPVEIEKREEGRAAQQFFEYSKKQPDIYGVSKAQLTGYAEKLIEVARRMQESGFDILLCPLRGARMPGLTSELIAVADKIGSFDGSDMGKRMNEDRIRKALRELVARASRTEEWRKVGVLDVAVGGDSCRELTRLLSEVHREFGDPWFVQFHLIHKAGINPSRADQAHQFMSKHFQISILLHEVPGLLIEDEPRLLGYDVSRGAGESHIFRYQQEGQILVYEPQMVKLYRRAPLDETIIALVADEIKNLIPQMPDITPLNLDNWPHGF